MKLSQALGSVLAKFFELLVGALEIARRCNPYFPFEVGLLGRVIDQHQYSCGFEHIAAASACERGILTKFAF